MNSESALRYDRSLDIEGEDSLSVIARTIATGSTVLDLGASAGMLGRYLHDHKGCVVDGAEIDPAAAFAARPHYRTLVSLDLEQATLADHFPGSAYDRIVCADVLEHLRDPGRILDQLGPLLAPGGRLLISVPNVAYAGVVAGLLGAEFRYRPIGLLDTTHLRFFTRATLLELLARHGFGALWIHPILVHPAHSEFAGDAFEKLAPALLSALLEAPDALVYQFIVEAAPAAGHIQHATKPAGRPQPRARLQAFWAGPGESYEDARSVTAAVPMRSDPVMVDLQLPELATPVERLRLDLGDRPGYLRLHGISVRSPQGDLFWEWDGDARALTSRHDLTQFSGPMGATWLSTAYDPFLELPLPGPALAKMTSGAQVRLHISWPLSTDHEFAISVLSAETDRWEAERRGLAAHATRLEDALRSAAQQAEQQGHELDQLRAAGLELQQRIHEQGYASQLLLREQVRDLREEAHEAQVRLEEQTAGLAGAFSALRAQQAEANRAVRAVSRRALEIERRRGLRALVRGVRRHLLRPVMRLACIPRVDVREDGAFWQATGDQPSFDLRSQDGHLPSGWTRLDFELDPEAPLEHAPCLSANWGEGFDEAESIALPMPAAGSVRALVALPAAVRALRFDLRGARGRFRIGALQAQEIGVIEVRLRGAFGERIDAAPAPR